MAGSPEVGETEEATVHRALMASLQSQNQDVNTGTASKKRLGGDPSAQVADESSVSALGSISAASIQVN